MTIRYKVLLVELCLTFVSNFVSPFIPDLCLIYPASTANEDICITPDHVACTYVRVHHSVMYHMPTYVRKYLWLDTVHNMLLLKMQTYRALYLIDYACHISLA